MSPTPGSIHRRARSDSRATKLWQWARTRRAPWTTLDAADAADLSPRRSREIIAALHDAGMLDRVAESDQVAAQWQVSASVRGTCVDPVMIVDGESGRIVGVRMVSGDARGTDQLRAAIERSGIATRQAARRLNISDSTLRRLLRGNPPLAADDPLLLRLRQLRD